MNFVEHYLRLNQYNTWANNRVLSALDKANFPADACQTFDHILGAEVIWSNRLMGAFPAGFPEFTSADYARHIDEMDQQLSQIINAWTTEDWEKPLEIKNLKGEMFLQTRPDILTHLFNHGSYHRGQIATRLRLAGFEPVATDFILFSRLH